jgi:hypothetical protein
MTGAFVLVLLLAEPAPGPWTVVDQVDGITVSSREVPGERVVELKAQTTSSHSVDALCTAVYGTSKLDKDEPDVTSRKLISETANERVAYETSSAPVVSDRDYVVRTVKEPFGDKGCRVRFAVDNSKAPPLPSGFVRIERLHGSWTFEPQPDGRTQTTYVVLADPGGSLPVVFVEGPRRKSAIKWVKMVLARATAGHRDGGRD